jgi:hypothetical protein
VAFAVASSLYESKAKWISFSGPSELAVPMLPSDVLVLQEQPVATTAKRHTANIFKLRIIFLSSRNAYYTIYAA